ncbi:MAG: lysine exporter LysO family protein [Patescibacteria group bacterium]|nr:lysine exporter LysO family protein [Patescibacteria group bacterium]
MFTVLILMAVGIILGFLLQNKVKIIKFVDPSINVAIYALLFLLGVSVGINETVINNLATLGVQALLLTFGGVMGSVVFAYFVHKIFFKTNE